MEKIAQTRILQYASSGTPIRLDQYVARSTPQYSRCYIQRLIKQGYVLVNQLQARANQKLREGDRITIAIPPPQPATLLPESIPLTIVYQDSDVLVINKPAGITMYPAAGHPDHTIVNAILAHCPDLDKTSGDLRPGIVHRLDKDTSGIVIIAKNSAAKSYLVNQFRSHVVTKKYIAMVKGRLSPCQGIIEAPIGRNPHNRKQMAIVETGKKAETHYHVTKYFNNYSLLKITLLTGRTHQIRIHLSTIGYPIVGDSTYGTKSVYVNRQFLHAYHLGICLPTTHRYKEFSCNLPPELQEALEHISHAT